MLKKIIRTLFFCLILVTFYSPVYADNRSTEIRLIPGKETVKIDGHAFKTDKPIVDKGVVMVSLRTFSEILGAQLECIEEENAVRVVKANKNIKFIYGKNYCYVDGVKKQIPSAMRIVKKITMVPLRFLFENFDGTITKNTATGEMITKFPFKDYENRFAYIKQGVIGDSYYGWSVDFPKGCSIISKKASGTSLLIKNREKGYYYFIYNTPANDINQNNLMDELLSYVDDEKIISKKVISSKGTKWAVLTLESKDEIYEYTAAIKNGRLYQLHFYSSDKSGFLNKQKGKYYQDIINSFKLTFVDGKSDVMDINEIGAGMYTYRDAKIGWEVKLPASVNIDVRKGMENLEVYDEKGKANGLTVGVEISIRQPKDTLNTFAKSKQESLYESVKGDYINNLEVEDAKINGLQVKKMKYGIKLGNKVSCFNSRLILAGDYKYNIYIYGDEQLVAGRYSKLCDNILTSFVPQEAKVKGVQIIQGNYSDDKTVKYEEKKIGLSFYYPESWDIESNSKTNTIALTDKSGLQEVRMTAVKGMSDQEVEKCLSDSINLYKNLDNFSIISNDTIHEKGYPMNKLVFQYDIDDLKFYYTQYIFKIDQWVFGVNLKIADAINTESNKKRIDGIWDSLKINFASTKTNQ